MNEGSLEIREKSKSLLTNILKSERGSTIIGLIPAELLNKLKKTEKFEVPEIKPIEQPE